MSELEADFGVLEGAEEMEPIDKDEIIDVDAMDLEDNDRWLYDSNQCSSESRVHDLYIWLKSDPVSERQEYPSLKKSIDTRTFTRAKRRSNRLSFDAIMESLSSPVKNSIETSKVPGQFRMDEATTSKSQEIPSMLRPKVASLSGLMGESQPSSLNRESLEAFLDLSQSKGIDSFINLTEPEFADCLMNESQPSLLYSSLISAADESRKNDTLCETDSGILTESMMQTSMFQESLNINSFREICSKDEESLENNLTRTLDQTKVNSPFNQTKICISPLERTYVNEDHSEENLGIQLNSVKSIHFEELQKTNEASPILHSNVSCNFSETLPSLPHEFSHHKFDTSTPEEGKFLTSETFESLNAIQMNENSMEDALIDADMTFNVKRLSCQGNVTENLSPKSLHLNATRNINNNNNNNNKQTNASNLRQELLEEVERSERKMDSTFSPEKIKQTDLTKTYENSKETFAVPLDYYKTYTREGWKKIKPSQVDKHQDFSSEIGDKRFQTFRKTTRKEESGTVNSTFLKTEDVGNVNATFSKNEEMEMVNTTFLKNENVEKVNSTFRKEERESEEDNVNATFRKPPQQIANSTFNKPQPRKLTAPRNLSKLPQFLQKSNPNIPTSNTLRTIKAPGSFAYAKGSHPNIPRAMDRMYSLGKYKSDSERLLGATRNSSEQIRNAGGSTESIESTQSAPDLDDRLSVCSDSSRSSYTISTTARTILNQTEVVSSRTMHKMMPHGFKPESTPKPNRQILENTWVQAENDLPSPILKNNIECPKSNNVSSHSDLKSSSPFFSPSSSSENIHSVGVVKNNSREFKAPKESEKLATKASHAPPNGAKSHMDSRPKLRPPTNYNAARPASAASGIPRPASRIPAPKFSRPLSRIPDQKKG